LLALSRDHDLLPASEVLKLDEARQVSGGYVAQARIADGYYVYKHSLKLLDARGENVPMPLPEGLSRHDEFFGNTEIFTGDTLQLPFSGAAPGPLTLHWQGCAEAGLCYSPQTLQVAMPVSETSAFAGDVQPAGSARGVPAAAEDQVAAQRLEALGPVMGALLFFGFGLLLAFTPCVLPMVPIVSTMVVGAQVGARRAFVLSLSYVLAMAATYAAVGVVAGLAGANLQATLQSPWLLSVFAVLFLMLAGSLFGLFELRMPSAVMNRVESSSRKRSGGSVAGAAALGLFSALLVGPCMTAPLAGALLYIGQTGSAVQGGLALFALGVGMGLPLLLIAVFGARVLPRPGAWMDRVRVAFGYAMAGMAVMMLARFLPAAVGLFLWGAWMLSLTVGLIAWAQAVQSRPRAVWALRTGAAVVGLWSVVMVLGAASGADSLFQPLAHLRGTAQASPAKGVHYVAVKSVDDVQARIAQAGQRGQWTLIDFYADWCVSCHVIERNVFGDAAVARRLTSVQVLRPDVTHNDVQDQALLKHWGVMGPPTLILIGPDGAERRALRMVGEINAAGFLARLDAAGAP
jgi:thiol:disulfide interchange protein DsbD